MHSRSAILSILMLLAAGSNGQDLVLSSGATVRLGQGLTLSSGGIRISPNSALSLDPGSVVVTGGSWSNGGRFAAAGGSVVRFTGSADKTLDGAFAFASLIIDGGTVAATSSVSVGDSLVLLSGVMTLADSTLTLSAPATLRRGSPGGFIATAGAGAVVRSVGASDVLFPVGPAVASYDPVILNNAGTPDKFSVRVQTNFDHPLPNPASAVSREWVVAETGHGGNISVTLEWNASETGSGFSPSGADVDEFRAGQWVGAGVTTVGSPTPGVYTASAGGYTTVSQFAVGDPSALSVNAQDGASGIPKIFALHQNFPNPFNPATIIRYDLPRDSDVRIDVFNPLGQKVLTLVSGRQAAGYQQVVFQSAHLASGVYYCRMQAGDFSQTMNMIILR